MSSLGKLSRSNGHTGEEQLRAVTSRWATKVRNFAVTAFCALLPLVEGAARLVGRFDL